jgi:hypothetical protein
MERVTRERGRRIAASLLVVIALAGCTSAGVSRSRAAGSGGPTASSRSVASSATWHRIAWSGVPAGHAPAVPASATREDHDATIEGWSQGYEEFIWDPQARSIAPWFSADALTWREGTALAIGRWTTELAGEETSPGYPRSYCSLKVGQFEEGGSSLVLRGWVVCKDPNNCGRDWHTSEAIWASDDGISWTLVDMPSTFGDGGISRISGGSPGFAGLGYSVGKQILWVSTNGRSWHRGALPAETLQPGSLAGDPVVIATGFVVPGVVREKKGPGASLGYGVRAGYASYETGFIPSCGGGIPGDTTSLYRGAVWWSPDGTTWSRDDLAGTVPAANVNMELCRVDDHTVLTTQETWDPMNGAYSWASRDGRTWTPGAVPVDKDNFVLRRFNVFTDGNNSVIWLPDFPKDVYVVDETFDLVKLAQSGGFAIPEYSQMALGPAGLIVMTGDSTLWLGIPSTGDSVPETPPV